METINGWNIFSMDDMIGRHNMMSTTVGIEDAVMAFAPAVKMSELQPFICPCCGGNKYRRIGSKVVCEFCDTQFE